jgi:DNA polymerase-3 subunit epsilon
MLPLARPLVCLDTETTGKNVATDRVVELGLVVLRPDGSRRTHRWLLNPGCPIPAEATEVHHITDADVADAEGFVDVVHEVLAQLVDVDLCGYNLRAFDLPILRAEFARAGVDWPCGNARVVDALVIFRERERHTLDTAVRRYLGRPHEGAHSAVADAEATLDVLLAQLAEYPDLPRDLAALDLASGGRQADWATDCGRVRWDAAGDAVFAFGKDKGRRLVDARGFAAWVAGKGAEFPADLVDLCRAASRGARPRRPAPTAPSPAPAPEACADDDLPF